MKSRDAAERPAPSNPDLSRLLGAKHTLQKRGWMFVGEHSFGGPDLFGLFFRRGQESFCLNESTVGKLPD